VLPASPHPFAHASNGQTAGSSGESFASKANATEAAENVKANAGGASVEEAS
jgi:uncharacterized protein YegP (UPF0339 family)